MPIRGIRPLETEIDCLATIGDSSPVRSFLRLPGQDGPGLLRMVDITSVEPGEGHLRDVKLTLLEGMNSTPGCLPNCFVKSLQMSIPLPAAFPIQLTVNSAILGSDEPAQTYPSLSISSQGAIGFLNEASSSMEEITSAGAVRKERASVPFGAHQLQLFEIGERDLPSSRAEVTLTWWMELAISGEAKTFEDWKALVMPVLSLMSFCLDEPLHPERIHTIHESREVDFYLRWRDYSAPQRPAPLLTLGSLGDRLADVTSTWGRLYEETPEFMRAVVEYQLRRNSRTLGEQFLLVSRCLELFFSYSDRYPNTMRTATEHQALVEQAMGALPPELRDLEGFWIEQTLLNSNRTGLLDQTRKILESFQGGEVLRFCGIPQDHDEFAKTVRDTRNFFTHPSSKRPSRVPEGKGLIALQHRLWFLLRACLLREMGFSDPEIVQILQRSGQSYYLIRG